MPDKETLVSDAGKLSVLDGLLVKLKAEGHRVLIYSQMTRMIDLLEEYMNHRKHTYIRLVFKTSFFLINKVGFKSEDAGGFLLLQDKYSKSLS